MKKTFKKVKEAIEPKPELEVEALINIYVHGKEVKKGDTVKIFKKQYNPKYFKLKPGQEAPKAEETPKRG